MGNSNSDGETTVDDCESLARPMPEMTAVSRRIFNLHLKNRSFSSWEEFIEALPSTAPQGASQSIVKCDPMDICSWVATFLIESCIWGLVAYFADQSAAIGIVLSALYGLVLFLCVDRWLSPQMAGMLWPNIPVAVGAVGALVATYLPDNDESKLPSRALIFCILPATLATIYWMRRLPEDPDRSTLVSNLFLGLWAATIALRAMLVDDDSLKDLGYFDFASLVVLGAISVGVAVWFFERPGAGHVEPEYWGPRNGCRRFGHVSDVCDRTSWNGTHWVGTLCDGALSHRSFGLQAPAQLPGVAECLSLCGRLCAPERVDLRLLWEPSGRHLLLRGPGLRGDCSHAASPAQRHRCR
ncbi:unnamed protein product [Durusdinium trenchii]|uniref:Uncharacterized protein n=1 Tax=Durusdinium trenchii TaxID=1381693 RepID=A0ABP0P2C0_9DINO